MPYRVTISTAAYKPRRCSVKNWEPGTVNDFIEIKERGGFISAPFPI